MFDEWDWLKQLYDFGKNVGSDSLAPWINRALPHLVSPTARMVRTHTPAVRRVAGNQVRDVLTFLRGIPQNLRNPWLWPAFLAIPVSIGMQATQWSAMVEVAGGALASLYIGAAIYFIIRGSGPRIVNRFR